MKNRKRHANAKNKFYLNDYDEGVIELADGTKIVFSHDQDCYENVWADVTALQDTGFENDIDITKQNLKIELVKGYGIRLNGYGIPFYNEQNGYYSDTIDIYIDGERDSHISCYDLDIFKDCY